MDNAHHREQNAAQNVAQDAAQNFAHNAAHSVSETHLLSLRKAWLQRLKAAHLSDPQMELNALWRTTTNDPLPLLACSTLTPRVARHITRLVERRANHEPLARITKATRVRLPHLLAQQSLPHPKSRQRNAARSAARPHSLALPPPQHHGTRLRQRMHRPCPRGKPRHKFISQSTTTRHQSLRCLGASPYRSAEKRTKSAKKTPRSILPTKLERQKISQKTF